MKPMTLQEALISSSDFRKHFNQQRGENWRQLGFAMWKTLKNISKQVLQNSDVYEIYWTLILLSYCQFTVWINQTTRNIEYWVLAKSTTTKLLTSRFANDTERCALVANMHPFLYVSKKYLLLYHDTMNKSTRESC